MIIKTKQNTGNRQTPKFFYKVLPSQVTFSLSNYELSSFPTQENERY